MDDDIKIRWENTLPAAISDYYAQMAVMAVVLGKLVEQMPEDPGEQPPFGFFRFGL